MKLSRFCRSLAFAFLVLLILPRAAQAQPQPASAHVNLYFAQIADGQFNGGRGQTAVTLVNTNDREVGADIRLYGSDGGPPLVDFGSGLVSRFTVRLPALGAVTVASQPPTLPVIDDVSYASRDLGVAIANPDNRTLRVNAYLALKDDTVQGPSLITLPPFGQTAFNVRDRFPSATDADAVLLLEAVSRPEDEFLAWTMDADPSGTSSSLPPGGVVPPISHWDRIWNVCLRVLGAAQSPGVLTTAPELKILYDRTVNAYAREGREVGISMGLSELLGDSDSELAFVAGHELAHIYQQRTGNQEIRDNPEFDADIFGTILALVAGYDAYAAAGTLAKLAMATGSAALSTQFEQQLSSDAHKSFNTRISEVYNMHKLACSFPEVAPSCKLYRNILHPHLPDAAPLQVDDLATRGYRRPIPLRSLAGTDPGTGRSALPARREHD